MAVGHLTKTEGELSKMQIKLDVGVPSAHNPDKRYYPKFNGTNWECQCEHYKITKTDCRHILQMKIENERGQKRKFNGVSYEPILDEFRLTKQIGNIFALMRKGEWLTLSEIEKELNYPQASISAQLRHLRKERFGKHIVDKRRRGDDTKGLWEYRLIPNPNSKIKMEEEI